MSLYICEAALFCNKKDCVFKHVWDDQCEQTNYQNYTFCSRYITSKYRQTILPGYTQKTRGVLFIPFVPNKTILYKSLKELKESINK